MSAQRRDPTPLWSPSPDYLRSANITRFSEFAAPRAGRDLSDYAALWQWSVDDLAGFWSAVWDWFGLDRLSSYEQVLTTEQMPGAQWFTGASLNYAEYLLAQGADDEVAILGIDEAGPGETLTRAELRRRVAALAAHLSGRGIGPGDVVAGYLPNTPEAVIAFLATASLGATWTSVGQDYAASAVVDRFGQLRPRLLITADGYRFGGREHGRIESIQQIEAGLSPELGVILHSRLGQAGAPSGWVDWDDALRVAPGEAEPTLTFTRVPFDHPLWVLFSSGTTGIPKGLVHGHGGVLIELLKTFSLQSNVGPGDRLMWYTSPSWVMWNLQATTLATGASIVCYDGAPTYPDASALWRIAADLSVTFLGISPGYLQASMSAGFRPSVEVDLSALRAMGSTGSPLAPEVHAWATREIGDKPVWSMSGGTDIASGFVGGSPNVPVWAGELSARGLGVALEAWDQDGRPVVGLVGEMVITTPMPSMPVRLWNDPTGSRLTEAYFSTFPGVWRQGDWVTLTERGSVVIHGRSDSTLNRNGVRMGSADIYAAVDTVPEVLEALVIGAEQEDGSYWMPLFVVLREGVELTPELTSTITTAIRTLASPRHVPDEVVRVSGVPHTKTGKKLEVPVKRLLQGHALEDVANPATVDEPALLDEYVAIADRHRS
ncbi:acetoacetate--CoA ligase [Kribbia dieselivorans]|uniref:acetoacetate--CoA ligase n=1 Tax=Kribbia dieselivorans TaxID=331526 RepID=UPI000837BA42|nr:acetoacetate--CoA ligase [Kribbia dieselivorans]